MVTKEILTTLSQPLVMGILNLSTDSFSGDGILDGGSIRVRVQELVDNGVHCIDVGAQSTRPGAVQIDEQEEIFKIQYALQIIKNISQQIIISVDTTRSNVAKIALQEGATVINDISGGDFDNEMYAVVAGHSRAFYVFGHVRGDFSTMHNFAEYEDIVNELITTAKNKIERMSTLGIKKDRLIFDPGIGFSKKMGENIIILKNIKNITQAISVPICVGLSRKRFIRTLTGSEDNESLDVYTLSLNSLALHGGVKVIRTHEVVRTMRMLTIINQLSL